MSKIIGGLLAFAVVGAASAEDKRPIPDVKFEITVQQRENGVIGEGYHILALSCIEQRCELTTIGMNQCMKVFDEEVFRPVVERSSTDEGDLSVVNTGTALLVHERRATLSGVARMTHKFTYEQFGGIPTLADYSGGMVKDSTAADKVVALEFVPLLGSPVRPLSCAAWLPTLTR